MAWTALIRLANNRRGGTAIEYAIIAALAAITIAGAAQRLGGGVSGNFESVSTGLAEAQGQSEIEETPVSEPETPAPEAENPLPDQPEEEAEQPTSKADKAAARKAKREARSKAKAERRAARRAEKLAKRVARQEAKQRAEALKNAPPPEE